MLIVTHCNIILYTIYYDSYLDSSDVEELQRQLHEAREHQRIMQLQNNHLKELVRKFAEEG